MSAPEFDGTPMTKREVLIAREAFHDGAKWRFRLACETWSDVRSLNESEYMAETNARYPLPKVTRPRVVTGESGRAYQLWGRVDGVTVKCGSLTEDLAFFAPGIPLCDVPVVADLLANPTEEVDA
jgi:hypothetical protein